MGEHPDECAAFAARWSRGRLEDLGFPARERALRAYRPLRADARVVTDIGPGVAAEHGLAVPLPLPARLQGTAVGRALAELPAARAAEILGLVSGVANTVAVADGLPLAESASVERSLRKALVGIDRGLEEVARASGQPAAVVLDRTPPLDLFRIGATADPRLVPRREAEPMDAAAERGDWDVTHEEIADEDRSVGPDGRPR